LPGRARVPCRDNGTSPYFGLSRALWTGIRSATSRRWSGTQACHRQQWAEHRLEAVREGQVGNQESRTSDPEWRDPAGRAQKGNNSSRRPYMRLQSAGSWISRSRGVKPSRSIRYQSKQLTPDSLQRSNSKSSRWQAAPWEPMRSKIATSRRSGLGDQESPI